MSKEFHSNFVERKILASSVDLNSDPVFLSYISQIHLFNLISFIIYVCLQNEVLSSASRRNLISYPYQKHGNSVWSKDKKVSYANQTNQSSKRVSSWSFLRFFIHSQNVENNEIFSVSVLNEIQYGNIKFGLTYTFMLWLWLRWNSRAVHEESKK